MHIGVLIHFFYDIVIIVVVAQINCYIPRVCEHLQSSPVGRLGHNRTGECEYNRHVPQSCADMPQSYTDMPQSCADMPPCSMFIYIT